MRLGVFCLLLILSACAPVAPDLVLPEGCPARSSAQELLAGHWLLRPAVWRLRQSALLEIGSRKIPLEGFLRLDLERREARLLAMNELGVVLFDLQVADDGQQLLRAVPQLQQQPALAQGVAQSLRQIFFRPQPQEDDLLEEHGNSQRLWRPLPGGSFGFLFDCRGDLRETRLKAESGDWRVVYDLYRPFDGARLPGEIVLNDFRHRVKLSLWLREVKRES